MQKSRIALAPFLASCPSVLTLGVRSCIGDYSDTERKQMRNADRVFFPTPRFADIFQAVAIRTFPSPTTYRYQRSRLLQKLLFQYLGMPHARSRIYFGKRQKLRIMQDFEMPFLIMAPHNRPGSMHIVESTMSLNRYIERYNPVIVQEAPYWAECLRFILVNFECVGMFRKIAESPNHQAYQPTSASRPEFQEILDKSIYLAQTANLDDIQIEWGLSGGTWKLIELASPPFRFHTPAGIINRHKFICGLIESGDL